MNNPDPPSQFEAREWLRYTRHIQLPGFGVEGQRRLQQSRVLVIGCGGLGSPLLLYLAAAGVGRLTLVDGDSVDLTNLQRQILYTEADLGLAKAEVAARRLRALNSDIDVTAVGDSFGAAAAGESDEGNWQKERALVEAHDLLVDCTDNFASRYLINDLCVEYNKPWVYASIFQFAGQCALFEPGGPCFRCLFPESPVNLPDCNTAGVLGVLPGLLGAFQANEVLKYLAGLPTPLASHLLLLEALDLEFRRIQLQADPACPVCSPNKAVPRSNRSEHGPSAGGRSEDDSETMEISAEAFAQMAGESFTLLDVRSDTERQAFHIGGEHIELAALTEAGQGLPKTPAIICYCQSGQRSLEAARRLSEAGYSARSLAGGLAAWLKYQGVGSGNINNE